jgi:hypothetical protein
LLFPNDGRCVNMLYSYVASPRSLNPERPYCSVAMATDHVLSYYRYISQWRHARSFEGVYTLWRHLFPAIHPMFQRNQRRYHVKKNPSLLTAEIINRMWHLKGIRLWINHGRILAGKQRGIQRKTCPSATSPTTNLKRTGKRPRNCLRY